MTAKPTIPPRPERWRRFTLMDALLLQAAFAAGFAVAASFNFRSNADPFPMMLRVVLGTMIGAALAGPLVHGVQWLVRGRRTPPSFGEVLWLALFLIPSATLVLGWMAKALGKEAMAGPLAMLGCGVVLLCPLFAFMQVTLSEGFTRRPIPCRWTDSAGMLLSLALPGVLLLCLAMAVARSPL